MFELLSALSLGAPLLAALVLGGATLLGAPPDEEDTANLARTGVGLGLLGTLGLALIGGEQHRVLLPWLRAGSYEVDLSVHADAPGLIFAALGGAMTLALLQFSTRYMHREQGFQRFFALLSLFSAAMTLVGLGGNAALTFMGWELGGLCSAMLIAYRLDRPNPARSATRAFVTNRVGDAAFVVAMCTMVQHTGGVDWQILLEEGPDLTDYARGLIVGGLAVAALCKSGQLPFSPWLARAMEGPTPSSALFYGSVMVHAGVLLLLRVSPLLQQSPAVAAAVVAFGALSAVYGWLVAMAQPDIKGSIVHAGLAQVGLAFVLLGLGLPGLALWHLIGHAGLRGFQLLSSPSALSQMLDRPAAPAPAWLLASPRLHALALGRFGTEALHDRGVMGPVLALAERLAQFDTRVIERASGLPLHNPGEAASEGGRAAGLVGRATQWSAAAATSFEDRLIRQGMGEGAARASNRAGHWLETLEGHLSAPWVPPALVVLTLLLVLGGAA